MRIFYSLEESPKSQTPVVLTVGNFDGVHRGHLKLLDQAKYLAVQQKRSLAAITFINHPLEVLRPNTPIALLCTLAHKIRLLSATGIDLLIMIPFTQQFSQLSAEDFLENVSKYIPFSDLILGHDATLGKAKSGDRKQIEKIEKKLSFKSHYIEPYVYQNQVVSSSVIRSLVQKGNIQEASQYLGRPYSIYAPVIEGRTHGKQLGFPTANIDVTNLCLPPLGVYAVEVIYQNQRIKGVANLGYAPTMRSDRVVLLEVHLLDWEKDLYHQQIEVIFKEFIRPEQKFSDSELLRKQIVFDLHRARQILM